MTPERQDSEVKRAEPDSEHHCSPVLRSVVASIGNAEGPGAERRASAARLRPSLSISNNCISSEGEVACEAAKLLIDNKVNLLTGGHKRTAEVLATELLWMVKEHGIDRVGVLTGTVGDFIPCITGKTLVDGVLCEFVGLQDMKQAQKRFHSLATNVLALRYEKLIVVWERMPGSGALHYHAAVVTKEDIRGCINFEEIKRGVYRSANAALRAEWDFWRETPNHYGFGRHELLPVKSTAEAVSRYFAKYVTKCIGARRACDKGRRLVRYIGYRPGDRKAHCQFGWNTFGGRMWRAKLRIFAEHYGLREYGDFARICGPRWAYHLQEVIWQTEVPASVFFSGADGRSWELEQWMTAKGEKWHETVELTAGKLARVYVMDS